MVNIQCRSGKSTKVECASRVVIYHMQSGFHVGHCITSRVTCVYGNLAGPAL